MRDTALDARLSSAAELVRQGAVFADVGTDHALLPLFLLKSGRIERAVVSDINEGPLDSAVRNLAEAGMLGRAEAVLTDGAAALSGKGVTDVAVCGMGGELIADIIDRAEFLRDKNIRLILQPMTKQAHLRHRLAEMGFALLDERYSFADGKYYVCILAEYTGVPYALSPAAAELGLVPKGRGRAEYFGYIEAKLRAHIRAAEGKRQGGVPDSAEESLILLIREKIKELKES